MLRSIEARTQEMKPKLAIITEFSEPHYSGGGERRYFEYGKRLIADYDVTWISMRQLDCPDVETLFGIRCVHIGPRIAKPPKRSVRAFLHFELALIWHLWTRKYDVVDAQPFSPLLGSFLATIFKKSKLVATIYDISTQGDDQFVQYGKLGRVMESLVYRLPFKRVVTVSESVKKSLESRYEMPERKLRVVHCGVSLESVDAIPHQEKVRDLILVARLVPSKHVEDFLEVCKVLCVTGAIIGEGPLASQIADRVAQMELDHQVTLLGKLENHADVLREIKRSRVFLLPSTREGFGIALVEAGACRVPVVAYEVDGVKDVVEHFETGFLAKPRDIPALCGYVRKLLDDRDLRITVGESARHRVEKFFTWDLTVKTLRTVYEQP